MRLRYSRKFETDLEAIGDYLEREAGAQVAEALVRRIRTVSRDLLTHPQAFPIWQVRPDLGLRRRVVGRYLIFYRVVGDVIELARIVHGARDIEGVLEDEG
jgi:plasmid stabilization system protein ParE